MKKNVCRLHGEMNESNAYACNNANGTIRLRCKECCNTRRVQAYIRDRERNIIKSKEWKNNNRERVNEQTRRNRHRDIELTRDKEATRKKGLSLERYYYLIEIQENKCAICFLHEKRKNRSGGIARLCIDHCHETGRIRGLLCHECNCAIGKFKDNPDLIQAAADYLRKHEKEG